MIRRSRQKPNHSISSNSSLNSHFVHAKNVGLFPSRSSIHISAQNVRLRYYRISYPILLGCSWGNVYNDDLWHPHTILLFTLFWTVMNYHFTKITSHKLIHNMTVIYKQNLNNYLQWFRITNCDELIISFPQHIQLHGSVSLLFSYRTVVRHNDSAILDTDPLSNNDLGNKQVFPKTNQAEYDSE